MPIAAEDLVRQIAPRLPEGVWVREWRADDLPRVVALENRYSRPAQRQTLQDRERWESMSDPNEVRVRLVLEAGPALVGVAGAGDGGRWRPPDRSWGVWLRLEDAWKRRRIGTAVADALEVFAREHGAPSATAGLRGDEEDGIAFARGRGYEEFHRRQTAYLDLAKFDASRFEDPEGIAARGGFRLASYEELATSAPDLERLRHRIHDLHTATWNDVPTPEIPAAPSFDDLMRYALDNPTFEPRATTFALRGDELVGLTLADVNGSGVGYTFMTGVAAPARGKGLALAMKLRAIGVLKRRGVTLFGTTNDKDNVPMLAVNRKLGYEPEPPSIRMKKPLGPA